MGSIVDLVLLRKIFEEHFNGVEINEYYEKTTSVFEIAEKAINKKTISVIK